MSTDRGAILSGLMQVPQKRQQENPSKPPAAAAATARPTSVLSNSSMSSKQHKLSKRFTVIRKLGKGTYGKVQLAINKETGQEVAIKTIKKSKIDNEEDMQRVRREIQIMRSIEHPHIIHIYEEFENKDKIVLIMQYAPGGELYEYVSQSKLLDDGEARRLFRQIATAIYYCHQNKICHRDLKLENILLDEKNNAKLADFGLSNVFDKQSQLRTFCGSPLYASPEIVQGSPYKGPEVDCWSLGVLLYTLVYGAMPFDGSNFKRLVKQISDASYYEPSEKSPASPLIRQLLCADPVKRATIIDICSDPWVNGAAGTPMSASSLWSPLVRTQTGSPKLVGASDGSASRQEAPPQHPSLLKVAQDMANLTPVRIDMLLALTMGEQVSRQRREEEAAAAAAGPSSSPRPPLAPISVNSQLGEPARVSPQHQTVSALDPSSAMEVDETRATSPVASYIVRDLEPAATENDGCSEGMNENHHDEEMAEISVEQNPVVIIEDKIQPQPSVLMESKNITMAGGIATESHAEPVDSVSIEDVAAPMKAPLAVEEVDFEGDAKPDQVVLVEHEHPKQIDEVRQSDESEVEVAMEEGEQKPEEATSVQRSELQEEPDLLQTTQAQDETREQRQPEEAAEVPQTTNIAGDDKKQSATSIELDKGATGDAIVGHQERAEPQQTPAEAASGEDAQGAKPKKVKKKIVVVRKRKKVVKKDAPTSEATTTESPAAAEANLETQDDKSSQEVSVNDKRRPSAAQDELTRSATNKHSKPGKVKIPDTFQATGSQQQQQQVEQQQAAQQSRRQSALIADVSQKLLQSVAAEPKLAAPTIIESDQLQLKNVRVSDKKDELERRASLALQPQLIELQPGPIRHSPSQSASPVGAAAAGSAEQQVEALRAELVREIQSCLVDAPPRRAESDVIEKLEPHSTAPASLVAAFRTVEESHRQLQTPPADERSDSLETIKADNQASIQPDSSTTGVRTRLQIDLGALSQDVGQEQRTGTATPNTAAAEGPAPIMRSYKKVTFTKDGACITETGKIFSTKQEDGSLRRIERKSKVTHYPAQESGSATAASETNFQQQKEEEEVVYSSGPPSRRMLERLIMPSRQLLAEDSDESDGDFLGATTAGSLFGRKQARDSWHEQRRGSASSCSSGSTDVLEDIFDTWTGAISMFGNQHRPGAKLFERAASRLSSGSFGQSRRRHRVPSSSQTGTPRCESVEPQLGANSGQQQRHDESGGRSSRQQHYQTGSSGYESDAAGGSGHQRRSHQRRPRQQAHLGARGLFGSWNLLNELERDFGCDPMAGNAGFPERKREADSFFNKDPFEILEQEQRSLRERLARQHKQLWKGSTPSLFEEFSFGGDDPTGSGSRKPPAPGVKDPRLPTGASNNSSHRSPASASDSGAATAAAAAARGQVGQSQSSSSFKTQRQQQTIIRQTATPLEPAPIRRNTTNFSPVIEKSASSTNKTTATTTRSTLQPEAAGAEQQHQTASTFIELKRTSSALGSSAVTSRGLIRSSSSKLRIIKQQQQQQQQQLEPTSASQADNSSSSSFWNSRETPPINSFDTSHSAAATSGDSATMQAPPVSPATGEPASNQARESIDRRVQSWLQESSGNLSATSSGSKSSTQSASISDSLHSGHRRAPDPFENLYGSLWQTTAGAQSFSSASSSRAKMMDSAAKAGLPPQAGSSTQPQTSLLVMSRTGSNRSISVQQQQEQEMTVRQLSQARKVQQQQQQFIRDGSGGKIATTRATSSSIIVSSSSMQSTATGTPLIQEPPSSSFRFQQQNVERVSSRVLSDDLDFDSLSGDLESRSSSSLLDQLRTKGYRSMINKRIVHNVQTAEKSSSATNAIDVVQESCSRSTQISEASIQQREQDEEQQDDGKCVSANSTVIISSPDC